MRWAAILSAILLPVLAGTRVWRQPTLAQPRPGPVLLVGLDGFEWDVLLPLVKDGRMPAIEGLMRRGVAGRLETLHPTLSPILWTSVATGKRPEKHGITGFVRQDRRGQSVLVTSRHRRTKALWNVLGDEGFRVGVVGWWLTYPVEPVAGVMVAQANTKASISRNNWKGSFHGGQPGQVHPPELEEELFSIAAEVDARLDQRLAKIFGGFEHDLGPLEKHLFTNSRWSLRADAIYLRLVKSLARREGPFDLTMVYLGGPDVLGHRFWRYRNPSAYEHPPSPEQIENLGAAIDDYYVYVDEILGRLLESSPEDLTVILVSDHGMKTINADGEFGPDSFGVEARSGGHDDAPPGVIVAAGPGVASAPTPLPASAGALPALGSVLDVAPTILAHFGAPRARDLDGSAIPRLLPPASRDPDAHGVVETHDDAEFLASRSDREGLVPGEEERLGQLRSLGYVP